MSQRARVILAMLILYVVWGTTYLGIKVGLDAKLPPALFAFWRQLLAAAIMFGIAAWRGARLKIDARDLRTACIAGILLIVGGQYFTFLAEQRVPSGLSALIVALIPLWIALTESFFPDMRRPGKLGWLGLAIGFSGLAILVWPRLHGVTTGPSELVGISTQIVGTWLWTAGTVYSKRHPVKADSFVLTAYETLIAGGVLLVIGTLAGEWPRFHPIIAVFVGAAAGRVGLVPPEPVVLTTLVGMVVIVAGVALTTTAPTLPARRPTAASASDELGPETTPSET